MSTPSSRLTRGYLICLTATVIWSFTGIFIRFISVRFQMPPLLLAFWRDLFVVLAMGGFFAALRPGLLRVDRRHLGFLALYGLALTFLNTTWTISVAENGAAVSTVLVYSSPALTAFVGWRLFGERLDAVKILAVALSILGCILVSGAYDPAVWQLNLVGVVTGLVSGVAFASYSLAGKAASLRQLNPWTALLYTFGWASLFLLVLNLLPFGQVGGFTTSNFLWLGGSFLGWGALLLLALGPTIAGYGLYNVSLGYLPSSVANLIATLEPVMTAMVAYLLLAERFNATQLMGSLLIITGVIVLRLRESVGLPGEDLATFRGR